ncbi:MAG: capsular biosynthesis protein [Sulfurihydrogenibium sp.]|jgi:capsule biosynthesis phosphatase|nr:capsular biosynthesis protein [Sulfurihydrogenibium sp.]
MRKRICIDLDGVICEIRKENQRYQDLKPIPGAVEKIKKLRKNGHYIIIYTSRRMKTHGGNIGKVLCDIGLITLEWLSRYGIEYDEIYFGKPWADVYIDDNALRFKSWNEIESDGSNLPLSTESKIRGGG